MLLLRAMRDTCHVFVYPECLPLLANVSRQNFSLYVWPLAVCRGSDRKAAQCERSIVHTSNSFNDGIAGFTAFRTSMPWPILALLRYCNHAPLHSDISVQVVLEKDYTLKTTPTLTLQAKPSTPDTGIGVLRLLCFFHAEQYNDCNLAEM